MMMMMMMMMLIMIISITMTNHATMMIPSFTTKKKKKKRIMKKNMNIYYKNGKTKQCKLLKYIELIIVVKYVKKEKLLNKIKCVSMNAYLFCVLS